MASDRNTPELEQLPWWRRKAVMTVAVTIASIVGFYLVDRQVGEWAWHSYQSEARARGIKLSIAEYQKPPIPDEDNYASAPIFRNLCNPETAENASQQFDLLGWPWRDRRTLPPKPPVELVEWREAFVEAGWIPSAGNDAATDILLAMERYESPLAELRLASSRPKTRWPIDWADGPNVGAPIGDTVARAGKCLELRAKALLVLNRSDEALGEIRHIVRAARSMDDEPTISFGLVRLALWNLALNAASDGVVANRWTDSHLVELSQLFTSRDHLADWHKSLSSERCFANYYSDRGMAAGLFEFESDAWPFFASQETDRLVGAAFCAFPRGWIRRVQAEHNRALDRELADIDVERGLVNQLYSRAKSARDNVSTDASFSPSENLNLHLSVCAIASFKAFELHMRAQRFAVLAALVRYRGNHGRLPESLAELVPKYMAAVPHDILDGEPVRYRLMEGGGGRVWSVSNDRTDHDGTSRDEDKYAHDWVSDLPPLAASVSN